MKKFIDGLIERLEEESYEINLDGYIASTQKRIIEMADVNKIINELAEECKGGWIPCSEMLPEEPEENPDIDNKALELYLVCGTDGKYPFRAFWNGKFFTDGWDKVDAVAWMPLPSPYDGKEEYKPRTNADKIRAMTDEELAEVIFNCPITESCIHWNDEVHCQQCIREWLQSEAKE